jgi:hypothetical protein
MTKTMLHFIVGTAYHDSIGVNLSRSNKTYFQHFLTFYFSCWSLEKKTIAHMKNITYLFTSNISQRINIIYVCLHQGTT